MRMPLERRDAVVAAIKEGQRPDAPGRRMTGRPDSEQPTASCAPYMLRRSRTSSRLLDYIGAGVAVRTAAIASAPDGKGSLGSTYFAAIILHWLRLLDGKPRVLQPSGFSPLFNEESLAGWEGDSTLWSVRDGMLVGKSPGLDHNEFLATRQSYGDFILSLRFRLVSGKGNSGVQFRSVRIPGTEMSGYQADIGENYWGCLYDESRRNRVLVKASPEALKTLKSDDWNHYVIYAMGDKVTLYLNGAASAIYREETPSIARDGLIAVQIHGGGPMEVQFRDLQIRRLP
ncbi:MAG: family 16 glycoside hydrolase [Isosphaeraceae bacterium]